MQRKALLDANKLLILTTLDEESKPLSTYQLAKILTKKGIYFEPARVSYHLAPLLEAKIVLRGKRGRFSVYSINPEIREALHLIITFLKGEVESSECKTCSIL